MTTLTTVPDVTYARVRLVIEAAAGGSLTRTDSRGTELVRAGESLTGDALIDDYEAPFGELLTYELDGVQATAVLDVAGVWLTHPTRPELNRAFGLIDDDGHEWSAPGTVHEPIGATEPIAVWSARSDYTGTLRLSTSWADRAVMRELLADGSPLLLRVPPGCFADTHWLWAERVRRDKSRPYEPSRVVWELEYRRVASPAGTIGQDPSNAWAALTVNHPSWQELASSHADWIDVAISPHPHALVGP